MSAPMEVFADVPPPNYTALLTSLP